MFFGRKYFSKDFLWYFLMGHVVLVWLSLFVAVASVRLSCERRCVQCTVLKEGKCTVYSVAWEKKRLRGVSERVLDRLCMAWTS